MLDSNSRKQRLFSVIINALLLRLLLHGSKRGF